MDPNDGPNLALSALATTLPMSCFPRDDVHPSVRYEPVEGHTLRLRNIYSTDRLEDILHAEELLLCVMPKFTGRDPFVVEPQEHGGLNISSASNADQRMCGSETLLYPFAQDQYLDSYPTDNCNVSATVTPISSASTASTASLDGMSNWSSSEPAPDFGIVPPNSCDPFLLQQHNHTTACHDLLVDGVHSLSENLPEVGRHESVACFNSPISLQSVPLLRSSPVERGLSAAHSTGYLDGASMIMPDPLPGPTDPNSYAPSATIPPAWQSKSSGAEGYNLIDHDFIPIDKGVDDFLDELGNMIDWGLIQPKLDATASGQIDHDIMTEMEDDARTSFLFNSSREEAMVQDPSYSDDDWLNRFIGEVGGFATFDQMLEDYGREEATAAAAAVSAQ